MSNDIVGNGMLAKVFEKSYSKGCIFFCSGVSNSLENNPENFNREKILLIDKLASQGDKCFVYFSSILASSQSNDYYRHKWSIENYIIDNSTKYIIMRLPQVAGLTVNNTIFPFFVINIYKKNFIKIIKNSKRTIVDVDDVLKGFDLLYNEGVINEVINFCPSYSFEPIDLANEISWYLNVDLNYKYIDGGTSQECKPSELVRKLGLFSSKDTYIMSIVEKYTSAIISESQKNKNDTKN